MKKVYNAPQAELCCFAPAENLAQLDVNDLLNLGSGEGTAVTPSNGDIRIEI